MKLNRDAFEAQFHNHDHYKELDTPDPEWWEVPHKARGGAASLGKQGQSTVDRALDIARKVNAR